MAKLNQFVAIEKGVKSRVASTVTDFHKLCQKPALFNGFQKEYQPLDEEIGETFPPESVRVQADAETLLQDACAAWTELFDITATKDFGNTQAKADVVVGDDTLLLGVPATHLLFLEKQLLDVRTFITKIPLLDASKNWTQADGMHKSDPRTTSKTKKVPRSLVMHEGDENHPPQVQMVAEDVTVGNWSQVDFSSAMTWDRQKVLLDRVNQLLKAVKMAREEANTTEIEWTAVGSQVFDWILS